MIRSLYHINLKKNFTLTVMLLLCSIAIGQNLYKVEYDLTLSSPFMGTEITVVEYRIQFSAGSNNYNYYDDIAFTNESNNTMRDLVVSIPFNPDTIEFFAVSVAVGSVPCDFPSQTQTPYNSMTDSAFLPLGSSGCTIPSSNGNPLIMARINGLESLNTSGGNNFLTDCAPRTIRAIISNSFSLSYKVEYQLGATTNNWLPLLPYAMRNPTFQINASDFPGIVQNDNLRLRISYDQSNTQNSRQILPLVFILCSPEIVGQPATQGTTCAYSNDGSFTITFDRPLDTGEQLTNLGFYTPGPDGVINTFDDVFTGASPPTSSYTGITYTFPNPLPAGEYVFSYQADNASSAELSDPFTISSPPSLAYTITTTDITCFEEDNGTITITIDPSNPGNTGSNPNYYYTINGGSPVTFNGLSTTITSLGVGSKDIKVFDFENCTERQ